MPGSADYPGSGIEISGIGDSDASLLVIDAKPDGRLVIRRKYEITLTGTALLADLGTLEAVVPTHLLNATAELPAFSLPLGDPVALAVFHGTTGLQPGVALNQPAGVGAELTANPIVDWVVLGPGDTATAAEAGVFTLSEELAAALGIDDLSRPIAPTFGVTTLARPAFTDQPELGLLLPGSIADGIAGASANLHDFAVSPGAANPLTTARSPVTPEPGSAVVWAGVSRGLACRKRRSRC